MRKNQDKAGGAAEASILSNPEAFLRLGRRYAAGQDGPLDLVEAHKWLNIAVMLGSDDAGELRHEVAAEMTKAQLAQALAGARAWFARRHAVQPAPVPVPVTCPPAPPVREAAAVHDIGPAIEKARAARRKAAGELTQARRYTQAEAVL